MTQQQCSPLQGLNANALTEKLTSGNVNGTNRLEYVATVTNTRETLNSSLGILPRKEPVGGVGHWTMTQNESEETGNQEEILHKYWPRAFRWTWYVAVYKALQARMLTIFRIAMGCMGVWIGVATITRPAVFHALVISASTPFRFLNLSL